MRGTNTGNGAARTMAFQTLVWEPRTATLRSGDGERLADDVHDTDALADALRSRLALDRPTAAAAVRASSSPRAWQLDDGRQLVAMATMADAAASAADAGAAEPRLFIVIASTPAAPAEPPSIAAALARLAPEVNLGPGLIFWQVDAEGRFTRVNRGGRGALLPLEELLAGRTLTEAFRPEGRHARDALERVAGMIGSGKRFQDVQLLLPPMGDEVGPTEWRVSGYPAPEGMIGLAIDDGFTRFLEAVPLPALVWEWSAEPRTLASNGAMRALTGLANQELLGLTAETLIHRTGASFENPDYQPGLGRMNDERFWIRNAETGRYELRVTAIKRFARGSGEYALAFFVNASETLDREQIGRARSFATVSASIAHDVGNAVTVLNGMLGCLVDSDRETRIELTEDIRETVDRMSALLNRLKLLSLGAAETDVDQPQLFACDPVMEIERAVKLFQRRYPELQIDVLMELPPTEAGSEPPPLQLSPLDLERAITNLLLNAVAACGQQGRTRVTCALRAAPEGRCWEITVEDDGPGFPAPPSTRPMQPRPSGTGSGLGLFQINGLVRSQGGALRLGRSTELGGASVELSLPAS